MDIKFLDLFAGIGGFRLGMEQADHECIGYVEWNDAARLSYESIHNTEGEWTANDIRSVSDDTVRGIGCVDIICGGFPCQTFSVIGQRKGFEDTRGTLFFEIMRFASILRPRYLFLENVTGLLNHNEGDTFETILRTLDELGYDAEWNCINSQDQGSVPHNRERVFIIGHLRGASTRKVFPIERKSRVVTVKGKRLADYRYDEGLRIRKGGESPCLRANLYKPDLSNSLFVIELIEEIPRIRRITPREAWRLQSFPDTTYEKAVQVTEEKELYRQAGNSVTVNVIYEIAKRLV